ncbi:MAG TPA: adenylosuccinate lyase, partial [Clostridiaceae bacterium]|nr:adenylosuccinate lyase [Clostridiaceae bacterium]
GSSAMAYKRNPMRSERMSSLSRFIIVTAMNPAITASTQWLERTLDDSANKRITIPEAFLACDGVLNLYFNISCGMVVYEKVINQHILNELPFMATENMLMEAVKMGGDRQELHERIREHSMEAARMVKQEGLSNDLIDRICSDPLFKLNKEDVYRVLKPSNFTGRASEQVDEFVSDCVKPVIEKNKNLLGMDNKINV